MPLLGGETGNLVWVLVVSGLETATGVFFSSGLAGALVELADDSARASSGNAACSGSSFRRRDGHGAAEGERPMGETTGDEGDEE